MIRAAGRRLSFVLVLAAAGSLAVLAAGDPKRLSVQVRSAPLRDAPSFLGKVTGSLAYGDRVDLVAEEGDWRRVTLDGKQGWLHASALTEKKVKLKAGDEDVGAAASGKEVALAGKGFNKQVEQAYREKKGLDYAPIDRMERMNTTPEERQAFLREGGLVR